jgi:crossover junction endodeoxyribonuclease RuvC
MSKTGVLSAAEPELVEVELEEASPSPAEVEEESAVELVEPVEPVEPGVALAGPIPLEKPVELAPRPHAARPASRRSMAGHKRMGKASLARLIAQHRPDACALEDAFLATNVKVSMKLGQVRGVVLLVGERAGLEIHEYSPRLIKQTVVGYGNAEKHQVQEMVRMLLTLKSVPAPHDAADALAVAICHFHHAQFRERIAATI